MTTFNVLIVGGSVAGLALANMLEKYGIQCTLIEKHDIIAPQLGASFAMLPQAARILDQLGCFERVKALGTPVDDEGLFGPDGKALNIDPNAGDDLQALLGYKMWALERRQLVDILYQNLADKSRVYTSCGALKIEHNEQGVSVETQNGHVFTGSIVVGADGVHSRIRQEMWNTADAETDGAHFKKDKNAIKSTYSCIFGISEGLDQSGITKTSRTCCQGRNYLYQRSVHGKTYWFVFFKNAEQNQGCDIPRYTDEDKENAIARFGEDILQPGITLRDLYEHRTHAVLVPLEEYVMERCYYRRVILIGDSFHKIHPLSGQGGASALESAAHLANQLKELTYNGNVPTDDQIQAAFSYFEQVRGSRTESLMRDGHTLARLESLDNAFLRLLMLHLVSKVSEGFLQSMLVEACTPAVSLKYLPSPYKQGIVPYEDEIEICPRKRELQWTVIWALAFILLGLAGIFRFWDASHTSSEKDLTSGSAYQSGQMASFSLQTYSAISVMAINGLWCLESYRSQLMVGPLYSAIPYILVSFFGGWNAAVPVYFALYVLLSHRTAFYYPSPRTIALPAAKALPIALILVYTFAIYRVFATVSMHGHTETSLQKVQSQPLLVAHATFPVVVSVIKEILKRSTHVPKGPKAIWGDEDIPHILRYQTLIFWTTTTAHLLFTTRFALQIWASRMLQIAYYANAEIAQLFLFSSFILLWLLFTVWDLRRVRATDISWELAFFYIIMGTLLVGPASCLAATWYWREMTLQGSHTRKSMQEENGKAGA